MNDRLKYQVNRLLVTLSLLFTLSACDVFVDQIFDCIDADGPEFNTDIFPVATLNQVYSYTVIASINREPDDESYLYDITFNGVLPAGLSIYRDDNDRTITIEGTPTEYGTFNFTLRVEVSDPDNYSYTQSDDYDDGDDLCFTTHEQAYVLTVVIM